MATLTEITPNELAPDAFLGARLAGRLQAQAFDHALRERERLEREDRLARLERGGEEALEPFHYLGSSDQLRHLERQVEILASFHRAVLGSRGWQLLQALRRLLGRAW